MEIDRIEKWKKIGAKNFELEKARMCLVNWGSFIIHPRFRIKTIEQALTTPTPSLATLTKYGDERLTALILAALISKTAKFFKVGGAMNHEDAMETAYLIIENYHWMNVADFKLCFQMGKSFKFGKLYDRFDGAIIMQWLDEYNALRVDKSDEIKQKNHHNRIVEEKNGWTTEGIAAMKDFLQTISKNTKDLKPIVFKSEQEIEQEKKRQLEKYGSILKDAQDQIQQEKELREQNQQSHE